MAQVKYFLHFNKEVLDKLKEDANFFKEPSNRVPIKFGLTINKKRLKLSTRIFINPNNWNYKTRRVEDKEPFANSINDILDLLQEKVFNMFISARIGDKPATYDYFKTELTRFIELGGNDLEAGKDSQPYFLSKFEEYLDDSTDKVDSTIKNYRNTINQLKRFSLKYGQSLTFANINEEFITKLNRYFAKDLRITSQTAGKHLKNLKAFLKSAYKKKYHSNKFFEQIKVSREKTIVTFLTLEEVKALKSIKLENKELEESRDIFLMGVFSGLRHSDIIRISRRTVEGEYLSFMIKKTKRAQRTYINKYIRELLEKYDYSMPNISSTRVTNNIRKVAKMANLNRDVTTGRRVGADLIEKFRPLHEVISTHMGKRTFVTLFFEAGGRMQTILQSTGNSDMETMKHYHKLTSKGEKEEIDRIMDKLDF
jgi:integrase